MQLSVPASRDGLGSQLNEYSVAIVLRLANEGLDRPLQITRAWFAHGRREGDFAKQVGDRLGCPVVFDEPSCGFAFDSEEAERPPRMADPALFEFHVAQARSRLASVGADDVIAHVSKAIEMRLPRGALQIEAIASALAITHRTLQRRLTEAGTSFRTVLAHVRRRRRAELVREGTAEAKIAELLGLQTCARCADARLESAPCATSGRAYQVLGAAEVLLNTRRIAASAFLRAAGLTTIRLANSCTRPAGCSLLLLPEASHQSPGWALPRPSSSHSVDRTAVGIRHQLPTTSVRVHRRDPIGDRLHLCLGHRAGAIARRLHGDGIGTAHRA
jgi:AraC-like DNA-binding protein